MERQDKKKEIICWISKNSFIIFCAILLSLTFFLYWDYLTFQKTYVFMDCTDSYAQTYPNLYSKLYYFEQNGRMPGWSFKLGLGAPLSGFTLFDYLLIPFGTKYLAYGLAWRQAFFIIFSGLFFFLYLKKLGRTEIVSAIGAIFYAFNGHMIVRGTLVNFPVEVFLCAVLLYGIEQFFLEQRYIIFGAICFLVFSTQGIYNVIIYSGLIIGYCIFRFLCSKENSLKNFMILILKILVCIFVCNITNFPKFYQNVSSLYSNSRFIEGVGNVTSNTISIFSITPINEFVINYLRTISMDAIGKFYDYRGIIDFADDGVFYFGLLGVLFIPQAFCNCSKKERKTYWLSIFLVTIYLVSPLIRFVANGFGLVTYKMSSYWIILLFFYLSLDGMDRVIKTRKINLRVLIFTLMFNIVILWGIYFLFEELITLKYPIIVTAFFILYSLIILELKNNKMFFYITLVIVSMIEICVMSWGYVRDRDTMSATEISGGVGYNDDSIECINYLNKIDSDIYRVDDQSAVFFNEAGIKNYFGTVNYTGGTQNYGATKQFIDSILTPLEGGNARMMAGFSQFNNIETLLGVKYIISDDSSIANYGYTFLRKIGSKNLYQNKYSLPLGFVYEDDISENQYYDLSFEERRNILLEKCVGNITKDNQEFVDEKAKDKNLVEIKNVKNYNLSDPVYLDKYDGDMIIIKIKSDSPKYQQGQIGWLSSDENGESVHYNKVMFQQGQNEYTYEIVQDNILWLQFIFQEDTEIDNIEVYTANSDLYYADYVNKVKKLQQNSFEVISFNEDNIIGRIDSKINGKLFFSIPYDKRWKIYVDNEEAEIDKTNIMFMSVDILKGVHSIELKYDSDNNTVKLIIQLLVILSLLFYTMIYHIRQRRRSNEGNISSSTGL